jgi:hypothetical protein
MLFQLVVALVVLSAASAATHLRGEPLSEDVPMNQALFDRYAAHVFATPANSNRTPVVDLSVKSKPLNIKKALDNGFSGNFFVTRKYKNGDCTGAMTEASYIRLNTCIYNIYGDAYSHGCEAGDEDTTPHTIRYAGWGDVPINYNPSDRADCSFNLFDNQNAVFNEGNKCETDVNNVAFHGYQTSSASCGETFNGDVSKEGLISLFGATPGCEDIFNPAAVRLRPFGVCELFVDHKNNNGQNGYRTVDANTDFFYMKKVSCAQDGRVTVHAYADPDCKRRLFYGYMNMNLDPMFQDCGYDPATDMRGVTFCTSWLP